MEILSWHLLLVLNLTKKTIKENKEVKAKKILRKSQPNFKHYAKNFETQEKNAFLMQNVYFFFNTLENLHKIQSPTKVAFRNDCISL